MSTLESAVRRGIGFGLGTLSLVAPAAAARAATRLWFTPLPLSTGRRRPIPDGAEAVRFSLGPEAVAGYVIGSGPRTALLVHGWAGSSRQMRHIANRLAAHGYRSVVVDLPGHGEQAGRATNLYEIGAVLEMIGSELGRLDLVVAHSLGAMATAVALTGSLEADRVVFVAPGLRPGQALEMFASRLGLRPSLSDAIRTSMEDTFGDDVWERVPRLMLELDVPETSIVIHDRADDLVPHSHAGELAAAWRAELVTTEGRGHNDVLRDPGVIDRIAQLAITSAAVGAGPSAPEKG